MSNTLNNAVFQTKKIPFESMQNKIYQVQKMFHFITQNMHHFSFTASKASTCLCLNCACEHGGQQAIRNYTTVPNSITTDISISNTIM